MSTLTTELEADIATRPKPTDRSAMPETNTEQTPDGAFRRQRNWFTTRFGPGPDQAPVAAGRYILLGNPGRLRVGGEEDFICAIVNVIKDLLIEQVDLLAQGLGVEVRGQGVLERLPRQFPIMGQDMVVV